MTCRNFLLFGLILLLVSGCGYPISKGLREEARKDVTFPMVLQNPAAYIGSITIWGGNIIETVTNPSGSEIIVLETPLDYMEMPESRKYSQGRFIAKATKFLDPEVYKKGKKITVAGEIVGKETRPLGKAEYAYPVLMVKQIHLWRKEPVYVYPPGYYGWYGPYSWPYGWNWYGPYWPYDYDLDERDD